MKTNPFPVSTLLFAILGAAGLALLAHASWQIFAPPPGMESSSAQIVVATVVAQANVTATPQQPVAFLTHSPDQASAQAANIPASSEQSGATPQPPAEKTATPPVSGPWQACPTVSYLSQLHVADTAMVSDANNVPNRVRATANLKGKYLGQIMPKERMTILEGPKCADGMVWWKVKAKKDGLTGWTAEGDTSGYWVIPVKP